MSESHMCGVWSENFQENDFMGIVGADGSDTYESDPSEEYEDGLEEGESNALVRLSDFVLRIASEVLIFVENATFVRYFRKKIG